MAILTVQDANEAGGKTFAAAAAGGDQFTNDGRTIFVVINGGGGAVTVTATAQSTTTIKPGYGSVTKADAVQSVEAATTDVMGPFPTSAFNNSSGRVAITYSGVTSVTVAAIKVP